MRMYKKQEMEIKSSNPSVAIFTVDLLDIPQDRLSQAHWSINNFLRKNIRAVAERRWENLNLIKFFHRRLRRNLSTRMFSLSRLLFCVCVACSLHFLSRFTLFRCNGTWFSKAIRWICNWNNWTIAKVSLSTAREQWRRNINQHYRHSRLKKLRVRALFPSSLELLSFSWKLDDIVSVCVDCARSGRCWNKLWGNKFPARPRKYLNSARLQEKKKVVKENFKVN